MIPRLPAWAWLGLGCAFTVLTSNRAGVPSLVWVAAVPFLVVTARARGWRAWSGLAGAVLVAQVLATAKIVTPPIPLAMSLLFGVPTAVGALALLGVWRWIRDRVGPAGALYAWPALTVFSDWLGFAHSDLSAWTSSANPLVPEPIWGQVTALGGMGLLGALVAWAGAWLATVLLDDLPSVRTHGLPMVGALLAAQLYGALRLDAGLGGGPTVRVAAVVTEVGPTPETLADPAALLANEDRLFARSIRAAERGAQVIVWNEAAAMLRPDHEAALLARGSAFARAHGVDLILAYAVVVQEAPVLFRNEYTWIGPDGGEVLHYAKHHPVPGEPSIRGDAPLVTVDRPYGRAGAAICYDWDFPATARTFAQQGAVVAFVPSSDWRGIDPVHTQMAGVRAVESGISVLRPVRAASSAGFDAYGRVRGWMSADDPEGVMLADLPTTKVQTVYARYGDTPILGLASVVLLLVGGLGVKRWRARAA